MKHITQNFARYLLFILITTSGCTLLTGTTKISSDPSIAIEGYDTVAYFTLSAATAGLKKYSHQFNDEIWQFSSQEHLDRFRKNPQQYLPQFQGYCANGLSDGHAIEADPKNWRIIDGKLYLFFSDYGREQWAGDVKGLIESARETLHLNES